MAVAEALAAFVAPWGPLGKVARLHGDGSTRSFSRLAVGDRTLVLLVGPDPRENAAYVRVGRHLASRGVRVPEILAWDEARGWILLEDVGDRNLLAAVREARGEGEVLALYGPVLDLLVGMQVEAARGFDLSVGFASAPYGAELMVEGEGLYFVREFVEGILGLDVPSGLRGELESLAAAAGRAPGGYFLHRDFQSRNLHVLPTGPAVIDFQGARPGPLGYDAAALILDPYPGHPASLRRALLAGYLERLSSREGVDGAAVEESYPALGTFRLLQALGAFGKLGGRQGKPGFLEHAGKALEDLCELLAGPLGRGRPALRGTVERSRELWAGGSRGSG